MTADLLPFPVRSRLTPHEREDMACDVVGEALVAALDLELNEPAFLAKLSREQRERLEESL